MLYETKAKPKDCLLKTNATQSTRYGGSDNNGSMSLNGIYNYYSVTLLKGHTRGKEREREKEHKNQMKGNKQRSVVK